MVRMDDQTLHESGGDGPPLLRVDGPGAVGRWELGDGSAAAKRVIRLVSGRKGVNLESRRPTKMMECGRRYLSAACGYWSPVGPT